MSTEALALLRPELPTADAVLPFLRRIDANGWYTNFGPLSRELESILAGMLPVAGAETKVTTVASGTLGLELALGALGLRRGARVLLPSLTFPATGTAVLRAGFEPVLADVDPRTWQLEPGIAGAAENIDAVLPVAIFGRPCDAGAWDTFSDETGLPVLIDAAGAFGNQFPGRRCPAVFSLHATKALAAGEGGFVAGTNSEFHERIRVASNFGFDDDLVREAGTNAKLSEYHAAVALAALQAWSERIKSRLELAERYARALAPMEERIELHDGGAAWVRSVFVVKWRDGVPEGFPARLAARGIETRRWYCPPLHRHPAFAACECADGLPHTNALAGQLLGLPFHLRLPEDAPERVAAALAEG